MKYENFEDSQADPSSEDAPEQRKKSKKKRTHSFGKIFIIIVVVVLIVAAALFFIYRAEKGSDGSETAETVSGSGSATFSFESGSGGTYALMGNDLIAASSTGVQIFDASGNEIGQTVLSLSEPALSAGETSALLFDIGSTDCFVVTETGAVRVEPTGSIITAVMASDGTYAIAADENGYKGLVTVYDASGNEVYKWYAGSGYPVAIDISPDGKSMAVLAISDEGTTMHFFSLSSSKEESYVTFGSEIVFDLSYLSDNRICLVTDACLYFTDAKGNVENVFDFGGKYLSDYDIHSDSLLAVVLSRSRSGSGGTVYTVSTDGDEIANADFTKDVIAISVCEKQVLVVTSDLIGIYSKNMGSSKTAEGLYTAKEALLRPDGKAILISSYSAEEVKF